MKKLLLALVLIGFGFSVLAQQPDYLTSTNLPYYSDDVRQGDALIQERCVLDLYRPRDARGFPTIVWFHGGGLTGGSKELPEALKGKGFAIAGVNYRLSPQVRSPKYIEDAAAAVAWVFRHIEQYGGDPSLIFVSGHSAGGYLTAMVGLDKRWLKACDIDANRIAGLIPLSGQMITHFTIRKERGIRDTQPIVDEFAPLYHVRADAPPLLLITGDRELELLGRYEENAYMMRMMKIAGHKETTLLELGGYGHNMTEPAFPLLVNEVRKIVNARKSARK